MASCLCAIGHYIYTDGVYFGVFARTACFGFFEFEFYHEKDRLIEFHDDEQMKPSYEYSYVEASKTCVNDYLAVKKIWFTFRPGGNNKDLPQYRVECENIAKGISIDSKEVTYPVMIKQRSAADDPYWHGLYTVNEQLKKICFMTEGKEEYPLFSTVCDRAGKGGGITFSTQAKSSTDNLLKRSLSSMMQELAVAYGGKKNKVNSYAAYSHLRITLKRI